MSAAEVAERLGVSERTIRNWAKANRLPAHQINKWTWTFLESDVERFAQTYQPDKRGRKPKAQ